MKIGWGWKIALLYSCFVLMMVGLVVASTRQKFDLVSADYYKDEIGYQKVLDASKNQSMLSAAVAVHANGTNVIFDLPAELKDKAVTGVINFYSPVNKEWDKSFAINAENNVIMLPRKDLKNTQYTIKISFVAAGRSYYQETQMQLHN